MYSIAGYPFSWLNNIRECVCVQAHHVTSSFIRRGYLGCFHTLFIINSAVNVGVQIFLWNSDFIFFAYIPRSGIARSNGSSMPLFLLSHLIEHFENCVFRDRTFVVTGLVVLQWVVICRKLFYWLFNIFMYNMRMKVLYSKSRDWGLIFKIQGWSCRQWEHWIFWSSWQGS